MSCSGCNCFCRAMKCRPVVHTRFTAVSWLIALVYRGVINDETLWFIQINSRLLILWKARKILKLNDKISRQHGCLFITESRMLWTVEPSNGYNHTDAPEVAHSSLYFARRLFNPFLYLKKYLHVNSPSFERSLHHFDAANAFPS